MSISLTRPSSVTSPLQKKAQPLRFSGREDALFTTPVYSWNPFLDRKEQIEKSQHYQDVVTRWDKNAQGNLVTKVGKMVAEKAGSSIGHVVKTHVDGLPDFIPDIIGNLAGDVIGTTVKPAIKRFTRPELESQRLAAEQYAKEIGAYGKGAEACDHIKKNMKEGYFFWFNKENHIGQFLKGLISRYGCDQSRVRSILPEIKGRYRTRDVIVPILERSKTDPLYITREVGGSWTGDQQGFVYEDYAPNPLGKAIASVNEGIQKEAEVQIIPSVDLHKQMLDHFEANQLREKLPIVIEYLED